MPNAIGPDLLMAMDVPPDDDRLVIEQADEPEAGEQQAKRRRAIEVLYGDQCPLLKDDPRDEEWASWARQLWESREEYMTPVLHRAERLRMFRAGIQWISAQGRGPWREPARPKDAVRRVVNYFGPALDWRLQVLTEQRPGMRARPKTTDPSDLRRAQASNLALEYSYTEQNFADIIRESAYWAQTDGGAFIRSYWDDDVGPDDAEFGGPLGDVRSRVYRIEQVRVSANATATRAPLWWVLREVIPQSEAVAMYGESVVDQSMMEPNSGLGDHSARMALRNMEIFRGGLPQQDEVNMVDKFTVFLAPNAKFLPGGFEVCIVGDLVVKAGPIPIGRVPMARVTDGSSDPDFFPVPQAEQWVDDQMTLNAAFSKFVENVRRNAGGRVIAKSSALVTDTLRGGQDSVIEVRAPGSLQDVIQQVQGFSIGNDAEKLIQAASKRLEDLTGFNETARGGMSSDASGRAILAVREQLERVFAPSIYAMARAMRECGRQWLAWMRWGYEVPRLIASLGRGRPDLGRSISSEDVDPDTNIELDEESMFPTPRSLRLFQMDDLFAKGLLSGEEYRKRLNFAFTNDLATPDSVQEARAMRICDAIRQGQPMPPMLWQDDEAIHQDVLERELLLAPDTPEDQMALADQRWRELAQQQAMKMPQAAPAPGGGGELPPQGLTLPPQVAPTTALPSTGLPTENLLADQTLQTQAARLFESAAPR